MNEIKNWNNIRRDREYWIAIFLLLGVALNITVWFSLYKIPIMSQIRYLLFDFYSGFFPSILPLDIEYMFLTLLTLDIIVMFLIGVLNNLCGCLSNIRCFEKKGKFSYLSNSIVIFDVVVGISVEAFAFIGLIEMTSSFNITSIGLWTYILMFIVGSYLYWEHTIMLKLVFKVEKLIKNGEKYENTIWYSISNCPERISTFSRVPWKESKKIVILDKIDLMRFENILEENFYYYLIVVDCQYELKKSVVESIKKITLLPHVRILALFIGEAKQYEELEILLSGKKNISILKSFKIKYWERVDIEKNLENFMENHQISEKYPLRFIDNEIIKSVYCNIGKGSNLCLDFIKIIIDELDILPAIYALFDFIDLQYRLVISCTLEIDFLKKIEWMKRKTAIIGNIGKMEMIIEKKMGKNNHDKTKLTLDVLFDEIFTDNDKSLIGKYLPNYKKDFEKPVEYAIVYLTTSLRNTLRGHGAFDRTDAKGLYTLIFKLAMLNCYTLDSNEICLEQGNNIIWKSSEHMYYGIIGSYKNTLEKDMSPFLVSTERGDILVFNNWLKESNEIEYINYLDGTLALIELGKD